MHINKHLKGHGLKKNKVNSGRRGRNNLGCWGKGHHKFLIKNIIMIFIMDCDDTVA